MATIFALIIYVALCVAIACDEFSGHNYDFDATFIEKVKDAICSWFGELRDVALSLWAIPIIGIFIDVCIALAPFYVSYIEKFYHLFC
jgi:hypothetical protein